MFEKLEGPFRIKLEESINDLNKLGINIKTSCSLILAFINYKDSLFNELYNNISYDDAIKCILKFQIFRSDLDDILKEASKLSSANGYNEIYDEYILYTIIFQNCDALTLLSMLSVDVEELKKSANGYVNEENTYLTNLTKEALNNKLKPYIGRKYFIEKALRILQKKEKNNCLLIGSAGVGKSALVEGLAKYLVDISSPFVIYRLDLGAIVAGTRYRGDLEERLMEVLNKIKNENTILFIDEIHTIINSGSSEGSLDIASILKPALARSEIKCIGATTATEYYKYIEKDEALARRFQKIFIPQANENETLLILKGIKKQYENYYNVRYSDTILRFIIKKASYYPNRYFPDKAIDILDESGALTAKYNKEAVTEKEVKQIVFENLGIINKKNIMKISKELTFKNLIKYYKIFYMNLNIRKNILNIISSEQTSEYLIKDLYKVFNLTNENIISVSNIYQEADLIYEHVLKYPIAIIMINYEKNIIEEFFNEYINEENNRKISFKNTIVIFKKNTQKMRYNQLGFSKNENNLLGEEKKYIDEAIESMDVIKKEKIKSFIEDIKSNKIKINISDNIDDRDYNYIIKTIPRYLVSKKITILKNNKNEILIKTNK